MMKNVFWQTILMLSLCLGLFQNTLAQSNSPLSVEIDRTSLTTDDVLNFIIKVQGTGDMPAPTLPSLDKFDRVSSGRSSQFSFVNGRMTGQVIYSYVLRPIETGQLVIGPVGVTIDGQTYTSEPVVIEVSLGASLAQPDPDTTAPNELNGQDFFIEAEVDNLEPYAGEQVVYTFRVYNARRFARQPRYIAPNFTGFWYEEQQGQSTYTLQISNRIYRITELQTILFSTRAGSITIDPATLSIPGVGELKTQALMLNVTPLPPSPPSDFGDAIGLFHLDTEISLTEGKVNEPINLLVTLSGQGNLYTLSGPVWPEIANWRLFEEETMLDAVFENDEIRGQKIYKLLLIPGKAGDFTLPPLTYSYFDPTDEVYRTLSTNPIPIKILSGDEVEPTGFAPTSPIFRLGQEQIERQASDIRHIKIAPLSLTSAQTIVTEQWSYWLLWGGPVILLLVNAVFLHRMRQFTQRPEAFVSAQAERKARRSLKLAQQNQQDYYNAAEQILMTYLSEKLNHPVTGLTQAALLNKLYSQHLDKSLIDRVQFCLNECDIGRFSPDNHLDQPGLKLLEDVEFLILDLEKVLV